MRHCGAIAALSHDRLENVQLYLMYFNFGLKHEVMWYAYITCSTVEPVRRMAIRLHSSSLTIAGYTLSLFLTLLMATTEGTLFAAVSSIQEDTSAPTSLKAEEIVADSAEIIQGRIDGLRSQRDKDISSAKPGVTVQCWPVLDSVIVFIVRVHLWSTVIALS